MTTRINFVLVGEPKSKSILGVYPIGDSHEKEAKKIFKDYCNDITNEENTLIKNKKKNDYFYLHNEEGLGALYLINVIEGIDEDNCELFVKKLIGSNIHLLIDEETKKLNNIGIEEISKVFKEINSVNRLESLNEEVNQTKKIMKENIDKQIENIQDMQNLEVKSAEIKSSSEQFKSKSKELSLKALWENRKWKIVIIAIIVIVILGLMIWLITKNKK